MSTVLVGSSSSCSCRSLKLFTFGCTLAVVLMTFQYEHKLSLFNSPRLMLTLPALSLISTCGLGAVLVGLIYPSLITFVDRASIIESNDVLRKSQVCKSLVFFVGINHLCVKIPFNSDLHFTVTLTLLCTAFWWCVDRSLPAFFFSLIISFILTMTTEILLRAGALQYTDSDFYLKTCVPCLTFAGAILTIQLTKLLSQPIQPSSSNLQTEHHMKVE